MNFSVYNTNVLNNFPESGIYTTYRAMSDPTLSNFRNTLAADEEYLYYVSPEISYVSNYISTIAVLDLDGNIKSRIKPNVVSNVRILYSDNNYIYFSAIGSRLNLNAMGSNLVNVYRFNKNTNKIDPSFCLGGWASWSPLFMNEYNNRYYIYNTVGGSSTSINVYPNLDANSSVGVYLIKDKKNISNLGTISNTPYRAKVRGDDIYICGKSAFKDLANDFPKIFKINKKTRNIDLNFYPIIERSNNLSTAPAPAGVNSDLFDFDFDNEGIYVGGNFVTVGGEAYTGCAKIDYSGNLINTFNPRLSGGNSNMVRTVLSTGSGLFIGGVFSQLGISYNLLKVNNDGSSNSNFLTTGLSALGASYITNLAITGNDLYVAGQMSTQFFSGNLFLSSNGWSSGIARINSENGLLNTGFSVSAPTNTEYTKLVLSGDNLYASAAGVMAPFTNFRNLNFISHTVTGVVKMNRFDGTPDTGFRINFNPHSTNLAVRDMFIKDNELHVVGEFTGIEDRFINGYAIVDTVSGRLLDTNNYFRGNASAQHNIRAITYSPNEDLYVMCAATSTSIYGTGYDSNYNSSMNVFNQNFNIIENLRFSGANNPSFLTTTVNFSTTFFNGSTGYLRSGASNNIVVAHNLDDGSPLPASIFRFSGDNIVYSMVNYNNDYYFGGNFSNVASTGSSFSRASLAKTDSRGTIDASFNLNLPSFQSISNLKIIDNYLYAMGSFTGVNGTGHNGFLRYNLLTNSIDTGFNNFLINQSATVTNIHNDSKNNLYFNIGGASTSEYTGDRGYFTNSGQLFKFNSGSYVPDPNFHSKHFILNGDIFIDNDKIYAPLKYAGKSISSNIYKINKKTRQILPYSVSFLSSGNLQNIFDIYQTGSSLYVGGVFTGVNNIGRTGICKLNKSDLSVDTNFPLNIGNNSQGVLKFLNKDNYLYCQGNFTTVSGTPFSGLCRIDMNNDLLDTSFKIDWSGQSVNTFTDSAISGKNIYLVRSSSRNIYIVDTDLARLTFTGENPRAGLPTTHQNWYILNTNSNLLFFTNNSSLIGTINPALIGGRTRGIIVGEFTSGQLVTPYSFMSNSLNNPLYRNPEYISTNNSVFINPTTNSNNSNNASSRATTSFVLIDKDKLYIKNKRGINWATLNRQISFKNINQYENYLCYTDFLFPNPEDNISILTNPAQNIKGIAKYNPITERYDVII